MRPILRQTPSTASVKPGAISSPAAEQAVPGWLGVLVALMPALAAWPVLFGPYSARAKSIAGFAMVAELVLMLVSLSGDLLQIRELLSYL